MRYINYNFIMQKASRKQQRSLQLSRIKQSIKNIGIADTKTSFVQNKYKKILVKKSESCDLSTSLNSSYSQLDNPFSSGSQLRSSSQEELQDKFKGSFDDKYIIKKKLGQGANGFVCLCQHIITKKQYAVKIFNFDEEHILGLKKNFIYMKQLRHPHVIKYKALYINKKKRCAHLIMEYIRSKSLADQPIKNQDELKKICRQLIRAIKYIHGKNICHRDIKPDNILYDRENGKIKLIDFGICKKVFERGVRRDMLTITGTSFYLAPEVYIGGGYDEKIDMWALGVTIYKTVTGNTPFETQYQSETVDKIIKAQVVFKDIQWEGYHSFLRNLVSRLLKKKEDRVSAFEAQKHLWFSSSKKEESKILRYTSYNMQLNEQFHHEIRLNYFNAASKQDDSPKEFDKSTQIYPSKVNFKKVNLVSLPQFQLEDSDNQQDKQIQSMSNLQVRKQQSPTKRLKRNPEFLQI